MPLPNSTAHKHLASAPHLPTATSSPLSATCIQHGFDRHRHAASFVRARLLYYTYHLYLTPQNTATPSYTAFRRAPQPLGCGQTPHNAAIPRCTYAVRTAFLGPGSNNSTNSATLPTYAASTTNTHCDTSAFLVTLSPHLPRAFTALRFDPHASAGRNAPHAAHRKHAPLVSNILRINMRTTFLPSRLAPHGLTACSLDAHT